MKKYRKRPVIVEARRLPSSRGKHGDQIENWEEIQRDFGDHVQPIGNHVGDKFECLCFVVKTLEGSITALPGDWLIRGIAQEVYPCRHDIFQETYECVE